MYSFNVQWCIMCSCSVLVYSRAGYVLVRFLCGVGCLGPGVSRRVGCVGVCESWFGVLVGCRTMVCWEREGERERERERRGEWEREGEREREREGERESVRDEKGCMCVLVCHRTYQDRCVLVRSARAVFGRQCVRTVVGTSPGRDWLVVRADGRPVGVG